MKIYIKAAISNILDEDREVQIEIARDPNTPLDVLEELLHAESSHVLSSLASNPNLTPHMQQELVLKNLPGSVDVELLRNPNCTPEVLDMIADRVVDGTDMYRATTLLVSAHPNTSDATLIKLAQAAVKYKNHNIAIPLAENPNLPEEGLLVLLDYDTHAHAVIDPIIQHPNVTPEVLKQLLIKDNGYCRYMEDIGHTHRLPNDFLWEFAINGCDEDMRGIANLDYTPSEILEYLIENCNQADGGYVSRDALKNPNLSIDYMRQNAIAEHYSGSIVKNPNCPPDLLEIYADNCFANDNTWSLCDIALHPNTPKEILYKILKYKEHGYRGLWHSLAQNPNIPTPIAEKIAVDGDDLVKKALAKNSNVAPEVLALMVKSKYEIREALANNPNTPEATLLKLAKDKSERVRRAVSRNPNLPEKAFDKLLSQDDPYINWALQSNPTYRDRFREV